MSLTRLKLNGLQNYGANQLGGGNLFTTGRIIYVDSVNGSDGNVGDDPAYAKSTLLGAQTAANASKGDIVVFAPGHTQSVTAVQTLSKAGVSYVGLGSGSLKPTITQGAAVDAVSITGANVTLDGFHFAAPGIDAVTAMVNVAAANATISNMSGIGSTTSVNVVDCITLASGATDVTINGVEIYNTTVPVNSFLSIEAAVARPRVFNFFAFGDCATAGIIDAATATQIHFNNVTVGTVGTTIPAAILDSNPTGLIENSNFSGTSTTLANNAALGTGVRLFNVKVLEETGGAAQGALIPAVDAD